MVWFLLAPLDLLISLLAFPMAPLIVLFTSKEGISPWWAWPWLTYDNPIDGDAGHLERWCGKPLWMQCIAWLWRNRGYNASYHWFGRTAGKIEYKGNPEVSDRPLTTGYCFSWDEKGVWQFYAVYPSFKGRCLRIRLGWKIWKDGKKAMIVTHINPFKGYSIS